MNNSDDKNDKKPVLSQDDADLWQKMTKDVDVMPGKTYLEGEKTDKPRKNAEKEVHKDKKPVVLPEKDKSVVLGGEIDGRTDQRLRRGQIKVEARLDLHGMTQAEARDALFGFIERSYGSGKRCVLVITGKGERNQGVLKQNVPGWLREGAMGQIVLKTHTAQIKDGGEGALYVYLRKNRGIL